MEKDQKNTLHRRRLIHEGHCKRIYESTQPGVAILEFKSDFSHTPDAKKVPRKAELNASVSHHIFTYLHSFHIATHHLGVFGKHELVVKKLDMIPIAVVVRNIAAGSLATRYGLPEGEAVPLALVMNELGTNAIKHRASRSDGIMVRVSGRQDGMVFTIENPGRLPAGFDLDKISTSVSGLGLVKSMLPRRGAKLTLEQAGSSVAARLQLFPPSIREDSV